MKTMKESIINNIISLLKAGYEITLRNKSIKIVEISKSISRDKYYEHTLLDNWGTFSYWEDGALHITAKEIRDKTNELLIKENKK